MAAQIFKYAALAAAGIAVAGVATLLSRPWNRSGIEVTLGEEWVVFDYSSQACDRLDVPDTAARAFRDARSQVVFLASHHVSRRSTGPDLDHLSRECEVVMRSHEDPRPERFDDREWIASPYTTDGRRVAALVHNEYQGHRHPGRCSSASYRRCWYNSITLATSSDGGRSFTHAEPPGHLVAALPTRYRPNRGPQGVFSASNIVRNPEDGYYYAMFQLVSDQRGAGTCVMRTRRLFDPRSWRAWNGDGFRLSFPDPYRSPASGGETCKPVSVEQIQTMRHGLSFNTYLDRFLLVGVAVAWDPAARQDVPGIYYSVSEDLVHWSTRRLVMEAELPWTFQCGDRPPVNYPSFLDPSSPSRNFETTSRSGYLYFTRLNYRECRPQLDRDLVRVPITLSKAAG